MVVVDDVVRNVAAPVLKGAGFRRGGRTFWLDHPDGWTWVIDFYRSDAFLENEKVRPGFGFQYSVVVPAYRDWVHRDGSAVARKPSTTMGGSLVMKQVFHPPYPGGDESSALFVYRWRPDLDSPVGSVVEALTASLENEVLPQLRRWHEPMALADELHQIASAEAPGSGERHRAGVFPIGRSTFCVPFALVDAGPSPALDEAIAALSTDHEAASWLKNRAKVPRLSPHSDLPGAHAAAQREIPRRVENTPIGPVHRRTGTIAPHHVPLILDGLGQFEVETASDFVVYVRLPRAVAAAMAEALTDAAESTEFVRRLGFDRDLLPSPPADRLWIQRSQDEAVLIIQREDGPERAGFVYLGRLSDVTRKYARDFRIQVFLVADDGSLQDIMDTADSAGHIDHPMIWGARVACTADG